MLVSLKLITYWVLERGISIAIVADGAMAVLVVVVSPGTREEEFGEDKLTLMPVAALTLWSIAMTMAENRGNNQLKKKNMWSLDWKTPLIERRGRVSKFNKQNYVKQREKSRQYRDRSVTENRRAGMTAGRRICSKVEEPI